MRLNKQPHNPPQPISQESHIGTTRHAIQEDLPTPPNVCQQPPERSNVPDKRRMTDMGTNTSDVVIGPTGVAQDHHVWRQMLKPPYQLWKYYYLLVLEIIYQCCMLISPYWVMNLIH